MNRIIVVGTTGSGKSRVARAIAEKLCIPYIEMDRLFWKPNWVEPPLEEFLKKVEEAVVPARWVLNGNYGKTHNLTWPQADTVVWIDYPFLITFYQNFSRALARATNRKELWPGTGNKESIVSLFSKKSILLWLIKTYKPNRQRYLSRMKDHQFTHIKFIHLRSRKEVDTFLIKMSHSFAGTLSEK